MIEAAATMLGINKYSVEGVGTVRIKEGTSKSINRELLIGELLFHVDSFVAKEIADKATKVSTYTSVEYRVK